MRSVFAWKGTILQMVGAALVASNLVCPATGYVVMLPGAVIWMILSWRVREWSMAALQAFFVAVNCLGIWRWTA